MLPRCRLSRLTALGLALLLSACAAKAKVEPGHELSEPSQLFCTDDGKRHCLEVRALAYTSRSIKGRKKGGVPMSASGVALTNGIKAVAVSPDLLTQGLALGTNIQIQGLEGEYQVLDTMSGRWQKTIDVYFGDDVMGARHWGSKSLLIYWN